MSSPDRTRDWLAAAVAVLTSDETDLRRLALLAGADPKSFYQGANLTGADLRGQNLRGMSFRGANLTGVVTDGRTFFGPRIDLLLIGPPGAGKGTQAAILSERFGLMPLATGDMLRAAIRAGTPIGKRVKAVMEAGELIADDNVFALIAERLDEPDTQGGIIFDGFPRTLSQAEKLDALLADHGRNIDLAIELVIDEEDLVTRITGRFSCVQCGASYNDSLKQPRHAGTCDACGSHEFKRRADDVEDAVRTRMAEYRAKTAAVLPRYEARGLVCRIDALVPVEEVSREIERAIQALSVDDGDLNPPA